MLRIFLGIFILCIALPVAAAPAAAGSTKYCQEAKELTSVTEQLPGYILSSDAKVPAKLETPMSLRPQGLLKASRGAPVCIAVVVDASGAVLDATAYSPKRVKLSRQERNNLLAMKFSPTQGENGAVKSILVFEIRAD